MDDTISSSKSPASVATELVSNHTDASSRLKGPPMFPFNRSVSMPQDIQNDKDDTTDGDVALATTKDDIEAHRPPSRAQLMSSFKGNLTISNSTRQILEQMSDNQVQDATKALEEVKQFRRKSGLDNMGSLMQNKRLSQIMESEAESRRRSSALSNSISLEDELKDIVEESSLTLSGRFGKSRRRSSGNNSNDSAGGGGAERRFSKSLGTAPPLDDFDEEDDSEFMSDSDRTGGEAKKEMESEGPLRKGPSNRKSAERKTLSKSMGAMATGKDVPSFNDMDKGDDKTDSLNKGNKDIQLKEVDAIADETFERIVRKHSGSHSVAEIVDKYDPPFLPDPTSQRRRGTAPHASSSTTEETGEFKPEKIQITRRPGRQRRNGLSQSCSAAGAGGPKASSKWKPLSSNQHDPKLDADYDSDEENKKKKTSALLQKEQQKGIGGLWNKLTASFTAEGSSAISDLLQSPPSPIPEKKKKAAMPKKEVNGATYFRRGKKRANKCEFLQAVALFNFALVRQREELGENHIDCATTLNEIGVCWMMLGERYPALTAFEEALYIRQKELGDGAMEVAETTNNIWMILHEERQEMEQNMNMIDEEEDGGDS